MAVPSILVAVIAIGVFENNLLCEMKEEGERKVEVEVEIGVEYL